MGHVPAHVMYICIFNDLMHHSLFINNARGLMPFIKRCSSNIKQDLVTPAVESNSKRLRGKEGNKCGLGAAGRKNTSE